MLELYSYDSEGDCSDHLTDDCSDDRSDNLSDGGHSCHDGPHVYLLDVQNGRQGEYLAVNRFM